MLMTESIQKYIEQENLIAVEFSRLREMRRAIHRYNEVAEDWRRC